MVSAAEFIVLPLPPFSFQFSVPIARVAPVLCFQNLRLSVSTAMGQCLFTIARESLMTRLSR